jgi:LCP family protein required for cell wall assembly
MDDSQEYNNKLKSPFASNWLLVGLVIALFIAGGVTVWLTFSAVRSLVASWGSSDIPSIALEEGQELVVGLPEDLGPEGETPLQAAGGPPSKPWDGNSRISVLFMGLDSRDLDSDDIPRTDTMVLLSLDPESRTAGMLSIPRDLWVEIPGFEAGKINTAYRLGEIYNVPGLGPGLAMQTVEELLGMEIDYYAQVDFLAFEDFIDELGGVSINVPDEIEVDPLGDNNNLVLNAGEQVLPGYIALAYARSRNTAGSDLDRMQRQQQVIMAIRNRILSTDLLPLLIKNSPAIYENLSSGISTNLTLMQLIRIAWIAQQIEDENVRQGMIGVDQTDFGYSYDGQDILRPDPDAIRKLRDEIFTTSGPITPLATETKPQDMVDQEYAIVVVLNGTLTPGLASQTTEYLRAAGINVAEPANADDLYSKTTLIDYTGNPYTVEMIVELMSISPENVFHRYDVSGEGDIVVITGEDWAINNPMQ